MEKEEKLGGRKGQKGKDKYEGRQDRRQEETKCKENMWEVSREGGKVEGREGTRVG